jgi:hypothetical protein
VPGRTFFPPCLFSFEMSRRVTTFCSSQVLNIWTELIRRQTWCSALSRAAAIEQTGWLYCAIYFSTLYLFQYSVFRNLCTFLQKMTEIGPLVHKLGWVLVRHTY